MNHENCIKEIENYLGNNQRNLKASVVSAVGASDSSSPYTPQSRLDKKFLSDKKQNSYASKFRKSPRRSNLSQKKYTKNKSSRLHKESKEKNNPLGILSSTEYESLNNHKNSFQNSLRRDNSYSSRQLSKMEYRKKMVKDKNSKTLSKHLMTSNKISKTEGGYMSSFTDKGKKQALMKNAESEKKLKLSESSEEKSLLSFEADLSGFKVIKEAGNEDGGDQSVTEISEIPMAHSLIEESYILNDQLSKGIFSRKKKETFEKKMNNEGKRKKQPRKTFGGTEAKSER